MNEEEPDSNDTLYGRMVGHLGDFISKVREEEEEAGESLFKNLEKVDKRYVNEIPIAKGGMKEIFRVDDQMTGRPVAKAVIKNLKSKETVEQFIQEARLTARLEHPNIMPVYDIGIDEVGLAFFTMKLVEGDNLGVILKSLKKGDKEYEERYPLARLLEIYTKVCDAVAFAHDKGVLHLDLKPDNIQVGDFGEVLVCDWGLSRFKAELKNDDAEPIQYLEGQLTLHGQVYGSPGFMSPEQVSKGREELDHRSDIYSLGCILYSILTLKPAFAGKTVEELLDTTASGKFERPSNISGDRFVPNALEAVCLHAMQFEPNDRYSKAVEIKDEVNNFRNGFATLAERAGILTQIYLFCRRHKGLVALGTVLVAVSITFAVIYMNKEEETKKVVEKLDQKEKETLKVSKEKEEINQQKNQLEIDAILRAKQNMLRLTDSFFRSAINSIMARDFKQAAEDFANVENDDLTSYITACNDLIGDYKDKNLPGEKLLKLITQLSNDLYISVIENLLRIESEYLTMPQKEDLSLKIFRIMNPESSVNFKVYQFLGKTYISMAKSKGLRNISALSLYKAHVLDLSETEVVGIEALRSMPLSSLNLSKTHIDDLGPVSSAPLQTLNISYSKVGNIEFLNKERLENLDIRGLELDIESFKEFKALKSISVSEGNKMKNMTMPFSVKVLKN